MKVIEAPNTNWTKNITCGACTAVLQIETTDLHLNHYDGDFREPAYDSYYVCCALCGNQCTISESDIPKAVKAAIKLKAQSSRSNYYDR
jgi:hypothetical protein